MLGRAVVAVGRWDLAATGPSLAPDPLIPVIGVVVVALVVNIVAIFRTPVSSRAEVRDASGRRPARRGDPRMKLALVAALGGGVTLGVAS